MQSEPKVGTRVEAGTHNMIFIKAVRRLGDNLFLIKYTNDQFGKSKAHRYGVFEFSKLEHLSSWTKPPRTHAWQTLVEMKRGNQQGSIVWRIYANDMSWASGSLSTEWSKVDATFALSREVDAVDFAVRVGFLVYKEKFDLYEYHNTETFSVSIDGDA